MADSANATGSCHQAEGDGLMEGIQLVEDKKAGFKHFCKWSNCSNRGPFSRAEELTQHLETEHFPTFDSEEFVLCLWEGCKVFNRPCNKKSWLSNHIKLHTKERLHKCLLNGCSMSFCSVEALQNHLQKHFQTTKSMKAFKGLKQKGRNRDWRIPSSLGPIRNSPGSSPGEGEDDISPECSKKTEKRRLSLRVRIPLHSSVSLSSPQSGNPQPVPVNGMICLDNHSLTACIVLLCTGAHIHSDLIDRKTMAVVKDTVSHLVRYSPSWSCDGICLHAEVSELA